MSRVRGFEIVAGYQDRGLSLPIRKTCASAGYDIAAAENVCLRAGEMALIPTGLKAYMQPDEYLAIHIRSSLSVKQRLVLANSQGIIDADYYGNADNDGHILVALVNHSDVPVQVEKGMRIAQGIFYRYLTVDGDTAGIGAERQGGLGSTGE